MSSQGNGQPAPTAYKVVVPEKVRALLIAQHLEAIQAETAGQFLAALHTIYAQLSNAPLIFGEPLYRLPALGLLVRQAMVSPLVVDYAVHETEPLVFIRGFKALS